MVEDDSQDGADHADAHRIPAAVISPYAKADAMVNTRYDLVSVVRSTELIIGMDPLTINDALAVPMYDAFTATPDNAAPYTAIMPKQDLLEMNTAGAPWDATAGLDFGTMDAMPQALLDAVVWTSVCGADSVPPPPGTNAEGEGAAGNDE